MDTYEGSKRKINKLIIKQQNIRNTIESNNYNIEIIEKYNAVQKLYFIETEWVPCLGTKYEDEDYFTFNFSFSYDLHILESMLHNVEAIVVFKGNIISYKELIDETVVYGDYNPNINFLKIDTNTFRLTLAGSGIGQGNGEVYAKLLISAKNYHQYKTIKKYE
jgi:hypothetical protein